MLSQLILVILLLQIAYFVDTQQPGVSFDFIVAGAGSAGSVVASRLSENPSTTVLLLEAGEIAPRHSEIPLRAPLYSWGSPLSWNYTVQKSNNSCLNQPNDRCIYYCGHAVGGGSAVNYMMYTRGSKADFDLWEEMGATGWNYQAVLPYFKKAEGVKIDPTHIDINFHGKNGSLTVTEANYHTALRDVFLAAAREAGHPTLDYNGRRQRGFATTQATIRDGYRCSTEKAYLRKAYGRQNFKLITGALVTKVHIDGNKRARGVYYLKDGETFYAKANKEVIVSAGSINTPKILLLSGIGPKKHLADMKIKLVADLPVGLNLHDHLAATGLCYQVTAPNVPTSVEFQATQSIIPTIYPDILTGPQSIPALIESFGYMKSPYEKRSGDYNDLQFFFSPNNGPAALALLGRKVNAFFAKGTYQPSFTLTPTNLHIKSRGSVTLASTNPEDAPIIQFNYLKEKIDLDVIVHGMRKAHEITKMPAFKKYNPELLGPAPGCEFMELATDRYFECLARHLTTSFAHAAGTSKMGQPNDPTTVVDPYLKVKGISRLRVIDASVMPIVVSANTNAASIMIGERGADIVKKEYALIGQKGADIVKKELGPIGNKGTNIYTYGL